jgi:hypothetical protein
MTEITELAQSLEGLPNEVMRYALQEYVAEGQMVENDPIGMLSDNMEEMDKAYAIEACAVIITRLTRFINTVVKPTETISKESLVEHAINHCKSTYE